MIRICSVHVNSSSNIEQRDSIPFCPRDLSVEFSVTKDISPGLSLASMYPYSNPSNDFANNEYDMNFIRITC